MVLVILGFGVGVGGAFIVAQQDAPRPAAAAVPGEPIVVTVGPPPEADFIVEIDADLDAGSQTVQVAAEASGTMRGERVGENIDVYVHLDGVEALGGGRRVEQPLDITVRYRLDPSGRVIETETIGDFGAALPIPINPASSNLTGLGSIFPPQGFRIGDTLTVTENQTIDNGLVSGDASISTTVTVSDLTLYQGREALAFSFDGTVDGVGLSGSFDGSALVDVASGALLTGTFDISVVMAGRGADVGVSFAMQL